MAATPSVHAMCGIVGSGKSTLARELAGDLPALRLSRDEWMLRLFDSAYDDPAYVAALAPCTELLWEIAAGSLAAGASVVLDWNHWSRERRADSLARCKKIGVAMSLHYVDVPVDTAILRGLSRTDDFSHRLDEAGVRHSAAILEAPTDDEGFVVLRH